MAIRSNWRAEAPDLIQIELRQKLRNDFDIVKVEPDSFFHEGQEIRYVTVIFKKATPASTPGGSTKSNSTFTTCWRNGVSTPCPPSTTETKGRTAIEGLLLLYRQHTRT